jgi:RHS repeat-associated protein
MWTGLACGLIFSPMLWVTLLASSAMSVSHSAHATNGQCKWENGPGAPTYNECLNEDCLGAGGYATCSEATLRPPSGLNDSQADGQSWHYNFADGNEGDEGDFCIGEGGQWSGFYGNPPCPGIGAGYDANALGANSEALAISGIDSAMGLRCGTSSPVSDTGWGATGLESLWPGGPVIQNGQVVFDHRVLEFSSPGCGSQFPVEIIRVRRYVCVAGWSRTLPSGSLQCVLTCNCYKVGDPVSAVTGANSNNVTDYRLGGNGGLEFARYYTSGQPFRVFGTGAFAVGFSDYWQFSYQRHLTAVSGNPQLMAVLQREDGTPESFDGSGNEMLNSSGAADRLTSNGSSGWTLTLADGDVENYNASGNLSNVTTRSGVVTTITYNASGKMSQIADSFGHTLSISYNSNGQLVGVTLPDGQSVISYAYSTLGQLTGVTYADGSSLSYQYADPNNSWLLTSVIDESGQTYVTFNYDPSGSGAVVTEQNAGGVGAYSYAPGSAARYTDPLGQSHSLSFAYVNGIYKLQSSGQYCPDCANVSQTTYDPNGNLQSKSDLDSHLTLYTFDQTRNLELSRTEGTNNGQSTPATRTITTQWHPTFRLPTQVAVYTGATATGTPLTTTAYTYDALGNLLTKTVSDGGSGTTRTWTYTYFNSGLYGQVHTVKGPRTDVNDTTTYSYYACTTGAQCGQLQSVTDALGHTTTFTSYDANGQPLSATDPNGVVTTSTYDLRQRLTSRTTASETTAYAYYPTGLQQKVTAPDGSYLSYVYDGAHRLTEIDDRAGNRLVYSLDAAGNKIQEQRYDTSGVLARAQSHIYSTQGLLWQDLTSSGNDTQATVYGYDTQGNQVTVLAPLSRSSSAAFDELNRRTQQTNPMGAITRETYDANDNLTSVTDPLGLVTHYSYNGFGDLLQLQSPDTGTTQYNRDSAGNVHSVTDGRNATAQFSYDALNRTTAAQYSDQSVQYVYDQGANGVGRINTISDGSGQTSFVYDPLGRVTQKTETVGTVHLMVGYLFSNGDLASLSTPSGQTINYIYNGNGQISGISVNGTTLLNQAQYSPFGPVIGWTWGNSSSATRTYNLDGWLTQIASGGTSTYTFNDDGSINSRSDDVERDYSVVAGTTALSSGAGSNHLTSTAGALVRTYLYDGAGNTTSNGAASYGYDGANRLTSAASGSTTTSFSVNALGQRVSKSSSGATTLFAYDESGHLIGEYDGSGNLIEETVWLYDTPVATLRPNASGGVDVYYVHTDHLNAPRKVSRPADNTIIWAWSSDPFGNGFVDEDPDGDGGLFVYNMRFPGQYYDQETGLNYNYMRDYDPVVGRYVESDPIGLKGGSYSTYAYVGDSPVMLLDPKGLAVQWTGSVTAIGATAGLGGEIVRFSLESECKCNKKYKISGFASFLTVGAGAKWAGVGEFLADAGLSHGHAEFTDPWDDCPNPDAANGVAWISGINVVVGAGASFLSTLNLGWLHSQSLADQGQSGVDISIQSGGGASTVWSQQQSTCCGH